MKTSHRRKLKILSRFSKGFISWIFKRNNTSGDFIVYKNIFLVIKKFHLRFFVVEKMDYEKRKIRNLEEKKLRK